jgi:uncharacterized membrane protein YfcA
MTVYHLILLGLAAGACAGVLAGLIGIGGGIVVVPAIYYGLVASGVSPDQAVHVAVATSLAAIMPAACVSFLGHWRAGNTDIVFFRDWGPGIAAGVITAQLAAPHLRGNVMSRSSSSHPAGGSATSRRSASARRLAWQALAAAFSPMS